MSRLEQMQADLQRKMLAEKEERMTKLYEDNQAKVLEKVRKSNSANADYNTNGNGNVRRFFNERRVNPDASLDSSMTSLDSYLLNASHGRNGLNLNRSIGRPIKGSPVGWDKSFPLVPIERTNSGSSGYESVNGKPVYSVPERRRPSLERGNVKSSVANGMTRSKSQILVSPTRNIEKVKLQQEARKREQDLIDKIKEQQAEIERMKREKIKEEKAQKARLLRKPIPGTVKPAKPTLKPTIVPGCEPENFPPSSSYKSAPASPSRAPTPLSPKKKVVLKEKPTPRPCSANSDFPACDICGRHFAPDRIDKHGQVCAKTTTKKRKIFDPVKMRTRGTELESFVTVKCKTKEKEIKKAPVPKPVSKAPPTKSSWREKHENFLQTIRQAKVVQQHVACGGKASDLPPPPPMDTSDYIQCPHCGRKFNEGVAERHVPKCQNIRSNKK